MLPLGPELGARCADMHRAHGVDLRLGTASPRCRARTGRGGRAGRRHARRGRRRRRGLGAHPEHRVAGRRGLTLDPGVVCDATLTSRRRPRHPRRGRRRSVAASAGRGGELVRVEHWTVAAEHGRAGRPQRAARPGRAQAARRCRRTSGRTSTTSRSRPSASPRRAERLEILESTPEGDRFVAAGARDGRLVGVVAFNAAKRLAWYRRQLAGRPGLRRDPRRRLGGREGARRHGGRVMTGARSCSTARWGPPGVLGDWAAARGIRARDPPRRTTRRAAARARRAGVRRLARLPAQPGRRARARGRRRARATSSRRSTTTSPCSASASAARCSPRRSAARSRRRRQPELGWHTVDTVDPESVPGRPVAAVALRPLHLAARRASCSRRRRPARRRSRHGRHLGVQFHPESTIEIVRAWARADQRARARALGIDDGEALLERGRRPRRAAAAARPSTLFDAFWQRTRA